MTEYTLYLGSQQDSNGHKIKCPKCLLTPVEIETARQFGGYTVTPSHGGWISPDGKLVREKGYRIEVMTDKPYPSIRKWANWVRTKFAQNSVVLNRITGKSEYIS